MARVFDREKVAAAALARLKKPLPPSKRLRALREAMKLLQSELAAHFGTSAPVLSDWERGKRNPEGAGQQFVEAWTAGAAQKLGLGDEFIIRATDWMNANQRARLDKIVSEAPQSPEAA